MDTHGASFNLNLIVKNAKNKASNSRKQVTATYSFFPLQNPTFELETVHTLISQHIFKFSRFSLREHNGQNRSNENQNRETYTFKQNQTKMVGLNSLRSFAAGLQRFQGYVRVPELSELTSNQDSLSPSKITIQIIILQVFYYVTAFVLSFSIAWILGLDFSLEWVFSWTSVTLDNTLGLTMIGLWLFDSLLCVVFMTVIVGRSKLAWDFAVTIHAINLLVVWFYSGSFPRNLVWWTVQVASAVILVSLGTWSTRWKELRETFFEGLVDPELGNGIGNQRPTIEMRDASEDH